MIVSASAPSALPVPLVSLAASDPKEGNASKSTLFKNVFDSLTLFQDPGHEGGAQEEGGSVPNSLRKKELPADQSSGTEAAGVPQVPILPKIPSQPPPSLMLPQPAHAAVAGNDVAPEQKTELPATSARGQSDGEAAVNNLPEPAAAPMRYLPASYSPAASNVLADGPSAEPAAPISVSAPAVKPAPTKAQAAARAPFFTQPGAKPTAVQRTALASAQAEAPRSILKTEPTETQATARTALAIQPGVQPTDARSTLTAEPAETQATARTPLATQTGAKPTASRQLAAVATDPSDAPRSIAKPAEAESVSRPPEPASDESAKQKTHQTPVGHPAGAAPQTSLPIRASGPVAEPVPNFAAAKPDLSGRNENQSSVAIEARAEGRAPAANSSASAIKSPGRTTRPDSKPLQAKYSANGPTASPQPTPAPVPSVTPAPASPSDAPTTPSANASAQDPAPEQKTARASIVSDTAAATSAPASGPAPLSVAHDVMNQAPEALNSASGAQHEAWPITSAPKTPLQPQAENFAFAVRMLGLETSPRHSPLTESKMSVTASETRASQPNTPVTRPQSVASQPRLPQSQTSSDSRREAQPAVNQTERPDTGGHEPSHLVEPQQTLGVTAHWNDAAVFQAPTHGSIEAAPEPVQAGRPDLPLAAQESHLLAPELPKTSASSQILLHLTGNDQSSAAIRVADRAGSVNVSVHASDPVLQRVAPV